MKGLFSNICVGCIAGITGGVILVSVLASFVFDLNFSTKELLRFYGIAMLLGIVVGIIAGWINCARCQSGDEHQVKH